MAASSKGLKEQENAEVDLFLSIKNYILLACKCCSFTACKVSQYGVFSGPYSPVYGPEKTPKVEQIRKITPAINIEHLFIPTIKSLIILSLDN